MLFTKTTNFHAHIAFLFFFIYPCEATNCGSIYIPARPHKVLVKPMCNKSSHKSSSLEPFIIEDIPSNNQYNLDSSNPIASDLLLNSNTISNHFQPYDATINSFENFDTTSMLQYPHLLDDTISLYQQPYSPNPLPNSSSVVSHFNQTHQPFQCHNFSNYLDNVSLNAPTLFSKNLNNLSWNTPFFFSSNSDNFSVSVPSPFSSNLDKFSLRSPSIFTKNLGAITLPDQSPRFLCLKHAKQQHHFYQQNNQLNHSAISPLAKHKSKKKKSVKPKTKNIKKFACQYCHKKFTRNDNRKEHEKRHITPKPFQCKECGKQVSTKWCLKQHITIHTGKPYQCDYCNKAYTTKHGLKEHQKVHTGEKPFVCDLCGKKFTYRSNWRQHQNIHTNQKTYPCDLCKKVFNRKQNYKEHMNQVHLNKRPYHCKRCGKDFKRQEHLQTHQNSNSCFWVM